MKQTQLLKGVLEGCVVLIIRSREIYGYELVQLLKKYGFKDIVGGTVYPLLQKLEKQGALSSVMKPSPEGPDRKYYKITSSGEKYLSEFIDQWKDITDKVDYIIKLMGGNFNEK